VADLATLRPSRALTTVASFKGTVSCRRTAAPLGLTLTGTSEQAPERLSLAFSGRAPEDLPQALIDASVERLDAGRYRIRSGAGEWTIEARAVHLHREIAGAFYAVIPPRAATLPKRLLWYGLLVVARSSIALRLLRSLRG